MQCRLSPDGSTLVAALGDAYTVHEGPNWDVVRTIETREPGRGHVAFRSDMSMVAIAEGFSVRLFELPTWRELATLRTNERQQISVDYPEGAGALEFSPDGRQLAVGTREGSIVLWDLAKLHESLKSLQLGW